MLFVSDKLCRGGVICSALELFVDCFPLAAALFLTSSYFCNWITCYCKLITYAVNCSISLSFVSTSYVCPYAVITT